MGLTLNQVQARIKQIVLAHKMVRSYEQKGVIAEFDNSHTPKYIRVELLTQPGIISLSGHSVQFGFKMFIEDLVNVSSDTANNEWDVVSDCTGVGLDILAQMNNSFYDDWNVSASNNIQYYFDEKKDRVAGITIDFTVSTIYEQNICAVPTELVLIDTNDEEMKPVYDLEYIGLGTEGVTLDTSVASSPLHVLNGQKILQIIREGAPLHKVSNNPDPAEFTWNNTLITLGTAVNQPINGKGERFLILYRKY